MEPRTRGASRSPARVSRRSPGTRARERGLGATGYLVLIAALTLFTTSGAIVAIP